MRKKNAEKDTKKYRNKYVRQIQIFVHVRDGESEKRECLDVL